MKKIFTYLMAAAALWCAVPAMADETTQEPALTMTVNRAAMGMEKTFQMSLTGGGTIQVDWGAGELKSYTLADYDVNDGGYVFSEVTGEIAGSQIKVYTADASKINYLTADCKVADDEALRLTAIDLSKLTGIKELSLVRNSLTKLDVSAQTAMTKVTASYNKLSSLELPASEKLTTVDVQNAVDLATGEVTEGGNNVIGANWGDCPNLTTIYLHGNDYNEYSGWWPEDLDISKNKALVTLNANGCNLPEIDLSNNARIKTLNAQWNEFETIDMSGIDLNNGGGDGKVAIMLNHNKLTSLKLPTNLTSTQRLLRLNISYNAFTFTTLPATTIVKAAGNFVYTNQAAMSAYLNGENVLDLSSQATVGEVASTYTLTAKDADGNDLALTAEGDAANYSVLAPGQFKMLVPVKDLSAEIANTTYPNLKLTTTPTTSVSLLPEAFSFEVAETTANIPGLEIYLNEATDVFVDYGDGNVAPLTVEEGWDGSCYAEIDGAVKGSKVTVKADPTQIFMIEYSPSMYDETAARLTSIDIKNLSNLEEITLNNNQLTAVDFSGNPLIESISLQANKITSFNTPISTLETLKLSNSGSGGTKGYGENSFFTFDLTPFPALKSFACSYTGVAMNLDDCAQLTTLELDGNAINVANLDKLNKIENLYLRFNNLAEVDLTGLTASKYIYLNSNNISKITLPEAGIPGRVYMGGNCLTFATLPDLTKIGAGSNYSAQQAMQVEANGNKVDLSSQAKVGDTATEFSWAKGTETVTDGIAADNGVFTFANAGEYVCTMTNAAYPQLTLKTVPVTIADPFAAYEKLFSFTVAPEAIGKSLTLNISSTDNQSVVVNWGNGTPSNPVGTKNYETTFEYGQAYGTIAGTEVTVYGSNPATINKLDLGYAVANGPETKMLTLDVKALSGMDDLAAVSNALTSLDLSGNTSLLKLYINGNKITDLTFPEDCKITRIEAQNTATEGENNLFNVDLSKAPKLNYLILSFNNKDGKATTIDLTKNVEMATLLATDCGLETLDTSKWPNFTQLTVNNNNFETLDVSTMKANGMLFALNNKLTEVKLPSAKLNKLNLTNNKLNFATLPAPGSATNYFFTGQKPMVVETADGKVDLTSQAKVGDTETVFAWTADSEAFTDYEVANGVFTFTKAATNAVCSMTNAAFAGLTLTTIPMDVAAASGVAEIESESGADVIFYNLQGVEVSGTEPGIYIRRQGAKTSKVIVK